MTTPKAKVTTASSENHNFDIESGGGGNGNVGSSISTTSPLQNQQPLPSDSNDTVTNHDTANSKAFSDNDTKETLSAAEGSSAPAAPAAADEAIPASSIQQTAMSGFAGVGCTSIFTLVCLILALE